MRVILQRHAPTQGNLLGQYIGHTDEALAPEGIELAHKTGQDTRVAVVHTSALQRTTQTAAILYPQAVIYSHPELNEMHFGAFEGKRWQDMEGDAAYAAWVALECVAPCPGGESREAFTQRCCRAFAGIVADARNKGQNSLHFVVHGGIIRAILHQFVVPQGGFFDWNVGYCERFVMESLAFEMQFTLAGHHPAS